MKYKFRYLNAIVQRGIVPKKYNGKPYRRAIDNGLYMGCPGKEIFYGLACLKNVELDRLAQSVAKVLPATYPGRGVHLSVFLRYVYGCFDKQGCLHTESQTNQWRHEKKNWELPDKFINLVMQHCIAAKKTYGYLMCLEMRGHRIGDQMILTGDTSNLDLMLFHYRKASKLARKIHANKNTFSPYFWGMRYLSALKQDKQIIIEWAVSFFNHVNRFSTSSTVRGKICWTLSILRSICDQNEWDKFVEKYKTYTQKTLHMNYVYFQR